MEEFVQKKDIETEVSKLEFILNENNPILFLGPDFSTQLSGGLGSYPVGDELKEKIITEFLEYSMGSSEYIELSQYSLAQIYSFAKEEFHEEIDVFIAKLYNNSPQRFSDQYDKLLNYPWTKIYTTGIDDLIENIFVKNNRSVSVENSRKKCGVRSNNQVELIKLHGCINNPLEGYIFNTNEYMDSIYVTQDYRFNTFNIDIQKETLIFLGNALDDFNFDFYLQAYHNAPYSAKGQLVFITPKASLILKSKISKLNGILIQWSVEEFLKYLDTKKSFRQNQNLLIEKQLSSKGFININRKIKEKNIFGQYSSNLHYGYEPRLNDFIWDWDFKHPIVDDIIHDIEKKGVKCVAIYGKSLVGKTCALYRSAVELTKKGFTVLWFEGKEFNTSILRSYINSLHSTSRIVVCVDNASYYYNNISSILKNLPVNNVHFITTSRMYTHDRKRYALFNTVHSEYYLDPKINKEFSKTIVQKLAEKGTLSVLREDEEPKRLAYFTGKNDLLGAMLELTIGKGYIDRFMRDIRKENDSLVKSFLVDLALFDKAELIAYPYELMTNIYKTNSKNLHNKSQNYIKETSSGYRLRSDFFTGHFINNQKQELLIENIKYLLIGVSPQIKNNVKNIWGEIFETFLKVKFLSERLSISHERIRHLIYSLKNYFDDSSYYWLQLGLSEQRLNQFKKALNYFKQAQAIDGESYHIKHAIGRNYLMEANLTNNVEEAQRLFNEGEVYMLSLIEEKELFQARQHSLHCYINQKINFVRKHKIELTNKEIEKMKEYLNLMRINDEKGAMVSKLNNKFYNFLYDIGKLGAVRISLEDLSKYNFLFKEIGAEEDEESLDDSWD